MLWLSVSSFQRRFGAPQQLQLRGENCRKYIYNSENFVNKNVGNSQKTALVLLHLNCWEIEQATLWRAQDYVRVYPQMDGQAELA